MLVLALTSLPYACAGGVQNPLPASSSACWGGTSSPAGTQPRVGLPQVTLKCHMALQVLWTHLMLKQGWGAWGSQ